MRRIADYGALLMAGLVPAIVFLAAAPVAEAHRKSIGPTGGISIESIPHGQMAVIARHRGAIFALADAQVKPDEKLWRLRNYAEIQFTACLWGLAPSALTDEESPFNECSHAYLAATMALLSHMASRDGARAETKALAAAVERDLLLDGTGALCQWSGEPYNTADVVWPELSAIPRHAPTALAAAGMMAALTGGAWGLMRLLRRIASRDGA
jgi:hypothetical protein